MSINDFVTLGIESSCDETGVGLYHSQQGLVAHQLFSQVEIHAEYGGVVPELASRDHIQQTIPLIKAVLADANLGLQNINGIAYTAGPGLAGTGDRLSDEDAREPSQAGLCPGHARGLAGSCHRGCARPHRLAGLRRRLR